MLTRRTCACIASGLLVLVGIATSTIRGDSFGLRLAVIAAVFEMFRRNVGWFAAVTAAGLLLLVRGSEEKVLWDFQVGFLGTVFAALATWVVIVRDRTSSTIDPSPPAPQRSTPRAPPRLWSTGPNPPTMDPSSSASYGRGRSDP